MKEEICKCTCHILMDKFKWPEKGIKAHWCCPKIKEAVKIISPQNQQYLK